MRPILFAAGPVLVGAYPFFILLAALTSIAGVLVRIRGRDVSSAVMGRAFLAALVTGWIFARGVIFLREGAQDFSVFSPLQKTTGSFTYFAAGGATAFLLFLLPYRKTALLYLDALAPSVLLAVAIAKLGCLCAGCCAGAECKSVAGITYPYGSYTYLHQWHEGHLEVPEELVRDPEQKTVWGHLQSLMHQQPVVANMLKKAGRDGSPEAVATLIRQAQGSRSLPVWPVPILVSLAAAALWIAAEGVYGRTRRAGLTTGIVLVGYGALRVTLDWLLASRGEVMGGLGLAQWVGLVAVAVGLAMAAWAWRRPPETPLPAP